jgi:hypothetical protein
MTISSPTRHLILAAACTLAIAATAVAGVDQTAERGDRDAALRLFHQRVEDYAALHRRLEGPLFRLRHPRRDDASHKEGEAWHGKGWGYRAQL